ncbi:MAG: glycosyltransferase family 2 protein, partial [Nanoarchaeota archaeon]
MTKLAVSIVNYNAGDYLINCLQSLDEVKNEVELKVYVVDNASSDDSIESAKKKFPELTYILNKENLGFGKAHNMALKKIKEEFILILNPDTKILAGTLKYMISFMEENPGVGAATCKILKENGTIDWASHRGFPTPIAAALYYLFNNDSLYHLTSRDMGKTHEVDAIVGAFFLTRKSVLEKVGLFDEKFFMYGEDIDLCLRIKKIGLKVMYI